MPAINAYGEMVKNIVDKGYTQNNDVSKTYKVDQWLLDEYASDKPTKEILSYNAERSQPNAFETINKLVSTSAPQVKVNSNGTGLVVSGSKEAVQSEMAKELKKYLKESFQYADLKSENVSEAIAQLNQDLKDQVEKNATEGILGVNYDDYKEYKLMMQQFEGTNPLKSTEKFKGYTKDGVAYKTVAEWLDYYQKKYTATERANLFNMSKANAESGLLNFADWVPYIVMSGGGKSDTPIYGFTTEERIAAGIEALLNEGSAKLVEGVPKALTRVAQYLTNAGGYARKDNLNDIAHGIDLGRDVNSSDIRWMSEDAFNKKLDSIIGKQLGQLTSDEKTFLAAAISDNYSYNDLTPTKLALSDENGTITDDVKDIATYKSYIDSRDNLSTIEKYDKEMDKQVSYLEEGNYLQSDVDAAQLYAPGEVFLGSLGGTMMRMWAEAGLLKYITGGVVAPAEISDWIADKVPEVISKVAPTSKLLPALQTPVGKFLLSVTAELPEDVVQTVIDDVLTGRAEDITQLIPTGDLGQDMSKLGASFAQNLAFRLAFTIPHAGYKVAKESATLKRLAQAAGLDKTVDVDMFQRNNEMARQAADANRIVDVSDNSVTVRMDDGTEQVLDNVAMLHLGPEELQERYPIIYELFRKKGLIEESDVEPEKAKLFDDAEEMDRRFSQREKITDAELDGAAPITKYFEDYDTRPIVEEAEINKIIDDAIPQKVQNAWYADSGDVLPVNRDVTRDVMAITALRNPEVRNAALNKAYKVFYEINPNATQMSFDEWINTPITLYRKYLPGETVGAPEARVLSYSMKEGGLSSDTHGSEIDTITIKPKDTTGMIAGASEGISGFRSEGEIFVPTELIEGHPRYLSVGDIVDVKDADGAKTISETPDSGSYKWESPDVTKTYESSKAVFADMPTGKNMTETRQWVKNARNYFVTRMNDEVMPKFRESYPTIDEQQQFVRNMDYLFDLQRKGGETLEIKYKADTEPKTVISDELKPYAKDGEVDFGKEKSADALIKKISGDTDTKSKSYYEKEYKKELKRLEKSKEFIDETGVLDTDRYQAAVEQLENKYSALIDGTEKKQDMTVLGDLLVDSAPSKDFREVQNNLNRVIPTLRSEGVSERIKPIIDDLDSAFTQKMNSDMVLYRGEPDADFNNTIKVGDSVDSSAYTYASPFEDYVDSYRTQFSKKGGVLYRYHTKAGQPVFYAPGEDAASASEIMLPRNMGTKITKISSNPAGKVFGKFVPEKIVDVEVTLSAESATKAFSKGDIEISGSALGKTYENEGITYTVNEDDVRFYLDNIEPIMKDLREAGAAGIGSDSFTIIGYLPHSDYDPELLSAEEALEQGMLRREYTGASTTSEDGNFSTGWLNPDLEARYTIFTNNMLWDSLGDQVTVAKFMEEFNADGLNVKVEAAERLVGGRVNLAKAAEKSDSVKGLMKAISGNGEFPTNKMLDADGNKIGSTDVIHTLYQPVYGESKGLSQPKNPSLMSRSDWMREMTTGDGSLYDNGGAMLVNGSADAKFMAKRIFDAAEKGEQIDVHQMFVEYLAQNQRRTAKGADYIANKWMDKIAQRAQNGGVSRRNLVSTLSNLIYGEGANRTFRFIGRMDTEKLSASNKKYLDSLLFRHSAISKVMNTSGISAKLNDAANKLISARMKSLFWLNYKNGVLQASECIRIFTEFDLGDALETIRRLAVDKEFRDLADEWVDMIVPERYIKSDNVAPIEAASKIAEKASYKNGELTIAKMSDSEISDLGKKFDEFASAPVEMGEALKNRVLMAGILQEAERKGLTGNELFNYVNQRFERIGLAANEMGRLNASDNPLFRIGANLKTFQIRQFRMFLNNIRDLNGIDEKASYIIKNLGWKAGLAVIMAKLGYSATSTLGIDPFDLMDDDYTGVDEENYTGLDYAMLSPVAKLFLSGGFTGYINDIYWASRKAYEDSASITEQTESRVDKGFWPGMVFPGSSFDDALNSFTGFIPGYTAGKRVLQMNELMATGWATSGTGNQMYEAPTNLGDIATGYLFGRSNTPQARAYYQTPDYLQGFLDNGWEGVGQQINRELFGKYRQFDPIDTKNYSDWFNGTAADEQQWNSGYYYFQDKMNKITDEYSRTLSSYTTDAQKESLRQSYNQQIGDIEEQIKRFTDAYERKHPEGIDSRKMRNLINILNTYQPVMDDTEEEAKERSMDAYNRAIYRYTQDGLPAVNSYKRNQETGEIEPVYSPQLRSALQGQFGLPEEAAAQIRQLYNSKWKKLNQQYRDKLFSTKGSKAKKAIQNEYINIVRQDLDPIVRLYGNNIWSNEAVENIIDDVFNSMIPKYGQTVKSYLKDAYKNYSGQIRYNESGNTTLSQINNLLDQGKTSQAKALARTLLQRVQENRTSLNRSEMERLQSILND